MDKFFLSYEDKDYEIPQKYFKRCKKILKRTPFYVHTPNFDKYKLNISYEEYVNFLTFMPRNKQCVKNHVDFQFQTKYMVEDTLKITEVNIDTFNKYKNHKVYELNGVYQDFDKIKVVLKNK